MARNLEQAFYRGDHEEIVKNTVDSPEGRYQTAELSFIIGALTFLGRLDEAEHLYHRFQKRMNRESQCAATFFLGIALCRQSNYSRAQALFARNLRLRRHSSRRIRTYAYQGLGFYRFFCGRYTKALAAGRKAFHAAIESRFLYGKFLSADLMGHSLIQVGEISTGLRTLEEVLGYSKQLGNGEMDAGVRIASAVYQAQYGVHPTTDLATLQKLHRSLSPQDTYSQSSLLLEMGRQLSLRGKLEESQAALHEACRHIYSSGHRRQGVTLNLRYAYNLFLSGELHQALNLLRTSAKELDPHVDKALELQLLGLEHQVRRALAFSSMQAIDPLLERIQVLSRSTGMGVARRILRRNEGHIDPKPKAGEDSISDLVDLARQGGNDAIETILRSPYLGLMRDCLRASPGECALIFDLIPDSLLMLDRGNVEFHTKGVSQIIRALCKELHGRLRSKEELIEHVWGHKYDRLRHDSLIYPAISRLRQILGARSSWVEAIEQGYRLRPGIVVRFHQPVELAAVTIGDSANEGPSLESRERLNHRQLLILRHFDKEEFLDVQACQTLFQTSKITATRDLSALHKLSLIQRVGKGRATRYRSNHFTGGHT